MIAGEVLPSAESLCRERGSVQGSVPHVHRSRSPALVWEDRTGCGLHRYENREQRMSVISSNIMSTRKLPVPILYTVYSIQYYFFEIIYMSG